MRVAPEQVPPYQAIAGDTHRTSGQTNPERDFRNRLWTFVPKGLERREIGEAEAKLHNALFGMASKRPMGLHKDKPDTDSAGIGQDRERRSTQGTNWRSAIGRDTSSPFCVFGF
jgi:hypothetical protein